MSIHMHPRRADLGTKPPPPDIGEAPPRPVRTRVQQAADRSTSAETLMALATDPDVTVRAAVTLNRALPIEASLVLANDPDDRVRALIGRKLAALLPNLANADQVRLRALALDSLGTLIADAAIRVRAAIAEVVREMPEAPHNLILRLAQDTEVPVSLPVIRLSPVLTPQDLLALVTAAQHAEVPAAVAQRRMGVTEAVSDALVATADDQTIRLLLANPSAAIREATLDTLIGHCGGHPGWQDALVDRPGLSTRAMDMLMGTVATHILERLTTRADLDPATATALRARLSDRLTTDTQRRASGSAAADPMEMAWALDRAGRLAGRLGEAALTHALGDGDARAVMSIIAVAARLPLAAVERAVALHSAKAIICVVWKAGYSMRMARSVLTLMLPPSQVTPPCAGSGDMFPFEPDEMRWQIDFLTRPNDA